MGKFDGDGFSKEPIEGDEAARHRHMYKEVSDGWVNIDSTITVIRAISVLSTVMKVGGPVALTAAVTGAYLKSQGWF